MLGVKMETTAENIAYMKLFSPSRSAGTLHEIRYNSAPQIPAMIEGENEEDFCSKSNIEECIQYLDKVRANV